MDKYILWNNSNSHVHNFNNIPNNKVDTLKKIKKEEKTHQFRLNSLTVGEIMDKYPDKVVDSYSEGKHFILVLDTCRIKFQNTSDIAKEIYDVKR